MVSPVTYKELRAVSKDPFFARRKVVEVYKRTGSIRKTARIFSMSRNTVRAIIREYEKRGEEAFLPSPRPPRRSHRRTPESVERKVLEYRASHPSWGVKRIAEQLAHDEGVRISPTTVWRILKRAGMETSSRKRKKNSGGAVPAVWVWEKYEDREGVILLQVDWKYILDKKALGTLRYDHIRKRGLPRYQLTLLESRSRLRLLFYAYRLTRENSRLGMVLGVSLFRMLGLEGWMVPRRIMERSLGERIQNGLRRSISGICCR